MIPHQLLRIKISNKGKNITPIFCTSDEDLSSAANMIKEFEDSWKKRDRKGVLIDRLGLFENEHGDHKLIRGFSTLLERRCTFANSDERLSKNGVDSVGLGTEPHLIRRSLFEESSKHHFALTSFKREEIVRSVADKLGVDKENVENEMWSDLDENLIVVNFDTITPAALVAWYNLAIMQTLLFSCTTIQLTLRGGSSWKRMLRDVKRVGLMYNIRYHSHDNLVTCSLDGPLSMFKMTEIYGAAIAKLIPSVISAESWSLQAWIVRNSISAGRKMYEFNISNESAPPLVALPDQNRIAKITTKSASSFDSQVEEKFAKIFHQAHTGWALIREPDPIILDNDKAFIPDFMFEKHNRRIYLEIVGYWTLEYIERKINKLTRISSANNELYKDDKLDVFIALNKDYCNTLKYKNIDKELSKLDTFVQKDHLILYDKGQVPLRPILSYLKLVDREVIRGLADNAPNDLLADIERLTVGTDHFNNQGDTSTESANPRGIISIEELAKKYNIPSESVLMAIEYGQAGSVNSNVNDNSRRYVTVGMYIISHSRLLELEKALTSVSTFLDATYLFNKYEIPESCYIELLTKLGYDIIWNGIDSSNASIEKKKE